MKRVTQKDIAVRLGLGRSTVSMALRDDPRISPGVREQIRKTAKELGYEVDPALAALAAYREKNRSRIDTGKRLAYLYPAWLKERTVTADFPLVYGLENRAAELGYHLTLFQLDNEEKAFRQTLQQIEARGIEGVVLNSFRGELAFDPADWKHFCFIGVGNSVSGRTLTVVRPNLFKGAQQLADYVKASGAKRPGLFVQQDDMRLVRNLPLYGFTFGTETHYGSAPLLFHSEGGLRTTQVPDLCRWIRKEKIDLLVDTGRSCQGHLREISTTLPHLAFASMDICEESAPPSWPGILQQREVTGRVAADLLIKEINLRHFGSNHQNLTVWTDCNIHPGT